MRKIKYIIFSIFSAAALISCSVRDDIRNDIDDLNNRLDKIETQLPEFNEQIKQYQGLLNGQLMVFAFQKNGNGDYTLELSDGTVMTVYSGKIEGEMPVMSIGEDGFWYYTINGETLPLLNDGEKVSANPIDGKTPQFRVNANGMWEYSYDGESWEGGIGLANPELGSGTVSIFENVVPSADGESLTFTWKNGEETLSKTVFLYGGLQLSVDTGSETPAFHPGESKEFTVVQTGVDKIVIETVSWGIRVDETKMYVTAPSVNAVNNEYDDKLLIKIFSKEGYCRLVTVPVKLLTV